jgi:hypothetical protein
MQNLRSLFIGTVAVFGIGAGIFGLSSCDTVDAAFDCQSVCERYRDCFDKDYDVGACRSSCRTESANDSTVRSKADACEACIDDMSCSGAVFNCGQTCGAIVP